MRHSWSGSFDHNMDCKDVKASIAGFNFPQVVALILFDQEDALVSQTASSASQPMPPSGSKR